jgi:CheY-like chemotaxis protein/nitrogen-specific signal transduction histidine kinase
MSHELRTPLNSMLILAKLLAEAEENLNDKQREFARTIYSSGSDLLELINEILDMSKIESGMMEAEIGRVLLTDVADYVERTFRQVAHDKALSFDIAQNVPMPKSIYTDQRRLQQVLKNLLSNAFKFTDSGGVTIEMGIEKEGWTSDHPILSKAESVIAFAVRDTGIGISPEKHRIVFEPFQQADGTTSRKYGGTGLGLSISREIATLLGGEIRLHSVPGAGSTFTLYLPATYTPDMNTSKSVRHSRAVVEVVEERQIEIDTSMVVENVVDDDRANIQPGDRTLLVIEDDLSFAKIMMEMARERGFKVLVALRGETGLALARQYSPSAITLDIELPGMDGWSVLDRLKHTRATRHIPVHILSINEERQRGLKMGAMAYENKPATPEQLREILGKLEGFVSREVKSLLVIEDDEVAQQSMIEFIVDGDVETIAVGTAHEAMERLRTKQFDCVVLDLGLPDMNGFELMERIKSEIGDIPIIIYTGKDLTPKEETELRRMAETIIVKDVRSLDRLLDETALFLHRIEENLPEPKRQMLEQLHKKDPVLAGKKVLVIDDDMRNIFALTSLLERYDMQVLYAENGRDGIETLKNTPGIDVALVDIMMPEMDGYEAMQHIRDMPEFKSVPLIALTAKAMKGDREKCIEAGASDYITKPADSEQLLSLLRVWLFK